ncbi:hypothetical protein AB1Y20_000185 [Prymnesium parvum]|uniref:Uncharacterized protein n=1 Tax=Prymnesium parvum TaxID=97485 RepID=A0AB34K4R0_PRYPA
MVRGRHRIAAVTAVVPLTSSALATCSAYGRGAVATVLGALPGPAPLISPSLSTCAVLFVVAVASAFRAAGRTAVAPARVAPLGEAVLRRLGVVALPTLSERQVQSLRAECFQASAVDPATGDVACSGLVIGDSGAAVHAIPDTRYVVPGSRRPNHTTVCTANGLTTLPWAYDVKTLAILSPASVLDTWSIATLRS